MVEPLRIAEDQLERRVEDVPPDWTRVIYVLPFQGDRRLWKLAPSTFGLNHPHGHIGDNEVTFPFGRRHLDPQVIRAEFGKNMKLIRSNLATSQQDVERSNQELSLSLRNRVEERRAKLERDQRLLEQL